MKKIMTLCLLVLSLSGINHHVFAADGYSTVNVFSKEALLAINWDKFPGDKKLKKFKTFIGADDGKKDWLFLDNHTEPRWNLKLLI